MRKIKKKGAGHAKLNNFKFIIAVAVVVLTVFAAVFISAKTVGNVAVSNVTDGFRRFFTNSEVQNFPYSVNSLGVKEIKKFGKDILVLCDNKYFVLSSSGKEGRSISLDSADTRAVQNNGRAMVYDYRKGSVKLLSKTETLADVAVNAKITASAIGRTGCFAVATPDEKAMSTATVYSADQSVKFSWSCATERIIAMAFTNNCKRIAIAAVGAESAAVYSRVVVFDLNSETPAADLRFNDTLVLGVSFSSNDDLFIVGDNCYTVYNKSFEETAKEKYAENSLAAFELSEDGAAIAVSEFGGSQTSVVRFDSKGRLLFKTTVDGEASSVAADGKKTALIIGKSAEIINKDGSSGDTVQFECEPDSYVYCSDSFFVLEENKIVKY